jgi:glycerol-3-phosphate cytidylyltransferase
LRDNTVGICFGAFDPLHIGHIFLFQRAKQQCDVLIVAVATDERIRKVKGYDAKFTLQQRINAIEELKCVDFVTSQGLSKIDVINQHQPDVIFVGDDWKNKEWEGNNLGVKVVYLSRTPNVSGTELR